MRLFYEEWQQYLLSKNPTQTIRPLMTEDFDKLDWECFLSTGFTQHYEILIKTKSLEERLFYIDKCASEFWIVEKLKYNLKENLSSKHGNLPNNFAITISAADLRRKALFSFKDEYLLDYINIESPNDEVDEHVLESEIVLNIKNFIMSLRKDFAFIDNKYRFIVE